MNEIAKIDPTQSSPFLELAAETLTTNVVGERLKFDKSRWVKGQSETPMPENARLLICMPELQIGWVKFVDGKPEGHRLGYVRAGFKMPDRNELGDDDESTWETGSNGQPKDPWTQTYIVLMRDMDTGELLTFLTNSNGGREAMLKLCQAYALGGYEEAGLCPVVALSSTSYQHPNPTFGKIWKPKFQITSWAPWTGAVVGEFADAVRDIPPEKKIEAPKAKTFEAPSYKALLDDEIEF